MARWISYGRRHAGAVLSTKPAGSPSFSDPRRRRHWIELQAKARRSCAVNVQGSLAFCDPRSYA